MLVLCLKCQLGSLGSLFKNSEPQKGSHNSVKILAERIFNEASLELGKCAKHSMKWNKVSLDEDLIRRETWLPTKLDWGTGGGLLLSEGEDLYLLTHNYNWKGQGSKYRLPLIYN